MKSFSFYLLTLMLALFMSACGKNNESGKFSYNNPYCAPGANCSAYTGNGQMPVIASGHPLVDAAQHENPCAGGSYYGNHRIPVQTQIMVPGMIAPHDIYLGVTSFGDVAFIQGTGGNQAILKAYVCPRSGNGQGQITQPALGAMSQACPGIKPITAMNMYFPNGQVAKFRDPSFGIINPLSGQRMGKFSFCAY